MMTYIAPSQMLLLLLLLCEVKVSCLLPNYKAHAVLQACSSNYKNIKTLENCHKKIAFLFSSTINAKTESVTQSISVNRVRDEVAGEDLVLLKPLVIKLQIGKPKLVYPLKHIKSVNNKAYEVYFHKENTEDYKGCKESLIEKICGSSNSEIDKHGFCCPCHNTDVTEPFHERSGQDCSKKWTPADRDQSFHYSTHCLKFDPVWYSVNMLKAPSVQAKVLVDIYKSTAMGESRNLSPLTKHEHELQLGMVQSPSNLESADGKVMVSLLLANDPQIDPLSYKSNRLLIPQKDQKLTDLEFLQLQGNESEFLVVNKKLIKLNGDTCNSIGVSYKAFVTQKNRCQRPAQSCLDNQPMNLWIQDVARKLQGQRTKYFLSGFPNTSRPRLIQRSKSHEVLLAMDSVSTPSVRILVQINADHIKMERNSSKAEIVEVKYGNRENLTVTLYNIGLMSQLFTVHLHSCNTSISQSHRKRILIPPNQVKEVVFTLKEDTSNRTISCTVSVLNQLHPITEWKVQYLEGQQCLCVSMIECKCQINGYGFKPVQSRDRIEKLVQKREQMGMFSGPHDPVFIVITLLLSVLNLGWWKASIGLLFPVRIGQWGLCLFIRGKVLNSYYERHLRDCKITFNEKGLPVHPKTKQPVQMVSSYEMFVLNLLFGFYIPFILFHWLCQRICNKDQEYQIKQEERFWKHKLNASVRDNVVSFPNTHTSPDSLNKLYKDVTLELYRKQKKDLLQQQQEEEQLPSLDQSLVCSSKSSSDFDSPSKDMTRIKELPGKCSKIKAFSQKESLQTLLQTDPVYCNFENSPTAFLLNSSDNFSLCGVLVRNGRKYKFQLGVYNKQTCHYVGDEVHRLTKPVRILHPQQFTLTMTASDVYRCLTLQPTYACLNALLEPFLS